jgi:chalcone isomerase-like protein
MTMKTQFFALTTVLIMFLGPETFAQTGTPQIEGVTLSTNGVTKEGQKLQYIGAGLRNKKVIMVNVKVYVGELFVGDIAKFKKTDAAKTVSEASPALMQLHFLRDVDAEKVQSSFKEALETNKIDLKKPEIQKFLEAVKSGGEVKKGKMISVFGVKKGDGSETITYEDVNSKATTIAGGAGFLQEVFAIWLGHPADDGVAKLKSEILK